MVARGGWLDHAFKAQGSERKLWLVRITKCPSHARGCQSSMNIRKYLMIAATSVSGAAILGAGILHAAPLPNGPSNRVSGLVNAIAQKFNLNVSDVQAVFDQQRAQVRVNQDQREKAFLDQAVKDGKITQDQENKIITKQAEVRAFLQGLDGKNPQDRQTAIKAEIDALNQWLKDNNIPAQYFHMGFGLGFGHRGRMMGDHGGRMMGWNQGRR